MKSGIFSPSGLSGSQQKVRLRALLSWIKRAFGLRTRLKSLSQRQGQWSPDRHLVQSCSRHIPIPAVPASLPFRSPLLTIFPTRCYLELVSQQPLASPLQGTVTDSSPDGCEQVTAGFICTVYLPETEPTCHVCAAQTNSLQSEHRAPVWREAAEAETVKQQQLFVVLLLQQSY